MSEAAVQSPENNLSPLGALTAAGRIYGDNLGRLLAIAIAGQLFNVAGELISSAGSNATWWAGKALLFPGMILHLWAGAAMIAAVWAADRGEDVTLKDCFDRVAPVFWWYVMAVVLYGLVWLVGLFLLVVMGLYWGTVYSLAGCVAVLEGPFRDQGPLRRSAGLVRGSFWRVLPVLAPLWVAGVALPLAGSFLLNLQGTASSVLGNLWWVLLWPLWTAVHVVIYRILAGPETGQEETVGDEPGRGACLVGCLAAVGLVVSLVVLYVVWTTVLKGPSALPGMGGLR